MSWHLAPCRKDPELFFPIGTTGPALAQAEEAKAVCRSCPTLPACEAYVEDHPEHAVYGVWAGMTEGERREVRVGRPDTRTTRVELSPLAENAGELIDGQRYSVGDAAQRLGVHVETVRRLYSAGRRVAADA